MVRSLNRCSGGILLPTTRFFHQGAMIPPHEDFLFITTPYDPSVVPTLLHSLECSKAPTATFLIIVCRPIRCAIRIRLINTLVTSGYTLDQYATHLWLYACLCRVSLGLTPKNLCVRRRWSDYQEIVRPPTGGQMTFKRYSRSEALPNLTRPYQTRKRTIWPLPSLTIAGDLTKHTMTWQCRSIPWLTKNYQTLPSPIH